MSVTAVVLIKARTAQINELAQALVDVDGVGKATEWVRFAMNFDRRVLFDAEAPMLPGFERAPAFVF